MKTKILLWCFIVALFAACNPVEDKKDLGTLLTKADLKFATPFGEDENTIILQNLTPNTIPIWDYGTGKSQRQIDTIHFAFKGDYVIKFSAICSGGLVKADSVIVHVLQDNLKYVNDPLWALLSGGIGKSKTWVFDNGTYGLSSGAMSYADPSITQAFENYKINWDPGNSQFGATANDLAAEMTFDLIGGPHLKTVKPNEAGVSLNGTYFLDTKAYTLTTTDVTISRIGTLIDKAKNWTNKVKVLELTKDQLKIAIFRDNSPSEGTWWYVLNFVVKGYVPGKAIVDEGFNPKFVPGELLKMLTGGVGTGKSWKLDAAGNPIDWIAKGKGWTKTSKDSWDWGWNATWETAVNGAWISFDQIGGLNYARYQNGALTKGTFTINEKTNEITLVNGSLLVNSTSWFNPAAVTTLKVVKGFNADFATKGIWFGTSYNSDKDEWMSFHYLPLTSRPGDEGFNPVFAPGELLTMLTNGIGSARAWTIDASGNAVDWIANGIGWTKTSKDSWDWGWSAAWETAVKGAWISFDQIGGQNYTRFQNGTVTKGSFTINEATNEITLIGNTLLLNPDSWMNPGSATTIKVVKGFNADFTSKGIWFGTSLDTKKNEWLSFHYVITSKK